MATRLYVNSSLQGLASPAYAAGWEVTSTNPRGRIRPYKTTTPGALRGVGSGGVVNNDGMVLGFVSPPLYAQTIDGSLKGMFFVTEGTNAAADYRSQMVVKVVSKDGSTVRGTLLDFDASALSNEWPVDPGASRKFPLNWSGSGATLTSVEAQDGDRIVVEIGFRSHSTVNATGQMTFYQEFATDWNETEGGTGNNNDWLEFSKTLYFYEEPEFVQALFSGQLKTSGTSLAITGSKTVTVGNLIVLAFFGDDAGTAFGCVDNLGNTYTLQHTQVNAGHVKTLLFTAPVTTGGTLTSQTVSWTTAFTPKAAVSAEFARVGDLLEANGTSAASSNNIFYPTSGRDWTYGELAVCAAGYEDNLDQPVGFGTISITGATAVASSPNGGTGLNGTTGGGSASNISGGMGWVTPMEDATAQYPLNGNGVASEQNAAASLIFAPLASTPPPAPAAVPKKSSYPQLLAH